LELRDQLGERLELACNFRSSRTIVEWVNAVFSQCMEAAPGTQSDYCALTTVPDARAGMPVLVLGHEWDADSERSEIAAHEAREVAAVVGQALAEGWPVAAPESPATTRPIRPSDVAVLVPTRSSLRSIEPAFAAAGIPTRVECETAIYSTPEVVEITMILSAIA